MRDQKTESVSYNNSELNKQFPSQQSKIQHGKESIFTIQETPQRINSKNKIQNKKIEKFDNEGETLGLAEFKQKQYQASKHQQNQLSAQAKYLGSQTEEFGDFPTYKKQYNYVSQNIEDAQDYKNQKIRQNHQNIQLLHDKLMKKKLFISSDLTMQAIQRCLPPKLRQVFGQNQEHAWLLNDMNNLNANFAQIIETVCGYRIELGVSLQNLVECYNSIFLQQFEIFYSHKLDKEHELEVKIKQTEDEIENYGQKLQRLLGLEEVQKQTLESKNIEIKKLTENEQNLQNTIDGLRDLIKKSKKNDEKLENTLERKKRETEKQGIDMDVKIERQKINSLNQELDNKAHLLFEDQHVSQLLLAMNRAELEQQTKQQYLQDIQKVMAKLMLNNSKNQSVQTEKSIWNEQKQYAYDYIGKQGELSEEESGNKIKKGVDWEDSEDSDVIERKYQEKLNVKFDQMIAERHIILEEQPNKPKKEVTILLEENDHAENQYLDQTEAIKFIRQGSKTSQYDAALQEQNYDQTENSSLQKNNSNNQSQTFDKQAYPQLYYNKSLRQNGIINENQIQFLHDSFDKICEQIKQQNLSEHQARNDHLNKNLTWKIPFSIIAFCANRIKQLIDQPENILKWELFNWSKFKNIIFSIYEHRLKHSHEINGHSNMNYCTLNEYILIYFVSIYKERSKAEEAIVDVFINLRYYYSQQSRAKMFGQNLECIFFKSSNILEQNKPKTENEEQKYDEFGDLTPDFHGNLPQNIYDDKNCPENDLYAQEFFLHAFSLFIQQKANFVESAEGKSYIRMRDHDRYAKRVISLIRGPCGNIQKWNYKAQQMVKKIVFNDTEVEYIDVDEILYGLMNEFKNQKSAFQQTLEKEFMRKMDTFSAAAKVSFEQFENLITDIQMGGLSDKEGDEARIDPLIQYTGTISLVRAYVFCLNASQANNDQFSAENFIAGISRYGIENPTPPVSQRCQLYGNTFDVMDMLKEAEKQYGALKLKIHTKRYTLAKPRDDIDRFGQRGQKQSLLVDRRFLPQTIQHNESAEFHETQQQKPFAYEEKIEKIIDYQDQISNEITFKKQASISLIQKVQKPKIKYESYLLTGGIRTQIQNVKSLRQEYEQELLQNLMQKKIQIAQDSRGTNLQEIVGQEAQSILRQSHTNTSDEISQATKQKKEQTMIQYAMSHKQIMIPSFSTTSQIFQTHLKILRDLKQKIDELKQAYQQQQDKSKSWYKVEQILSLLSNACIFLDFPSNHYLNQFKEFIKDDSHIGINRQNKNKQLKQSNLIKSIIQQRDDPNNQIVEVNSDEEEDSVQENKIQQQVDNNLQQEQQQDLQQKSDDL